jgi:hypothetical protein
MSLGWRLCWSPSDVVWPINELYLLLGWSSSAMMCAVVSSPADMIWPVSEFCLLL